MVYVFLSTTSNVFLCTISDILLSNASSFSCNGADVVMDVDTPTSGIGDYLVLFTVLLSFFEENLDIIDPFAGGIFFLFRACIEDI